MHAKKTAEIVLLNVFRIGFPSSLFWSLRVIRVKVFHVYSVMPPPSPLTNSIF